MNIIIVGVIVFVVCAVIAALVYVYREEVFKNFFTQETKKLEEDLKKKCEEEKLTLKEASKKLLEEEAAKRVSEVAALNTELQSKIDEGILSKDQAISEMEKTLEQHKAEIATLKQNLETAQKDIISAQEESSKKINVPTPWVCSIDKVPAPIRVNADKNVECMSNNGWDCQWSATVEECKKKIDTLKDTYTNPQICSEEAYASPGHWCERGKAVYGI